MGLVEQWRRIWSELPPSWGEAKLNVSVPGADQRSRAAALLGPAGPGRLGDDLRVSVHRAGGGIGPDQADKLFGKLDDEKIRGTVSLVTVDERAEREEAPSGGVAGLWDAALATVPADWSDLLCELELTSSDHLAGAALLLAPLNPTRVPGRSAFRFRAARRFGYGASPADDAPLPRAPRRRGHPGQADAPARSLRHPQRRHTGSRLARRGKGCLAVTGDPVAWLLIEPGWTVYDANGEKVGKVKQVLADEQADIFHGVLVERGLLGDEEEIVADRIAGIHESRPSPGVAAQVCRNRAAATFCPCRNPVRPRRADRLRRTVHNTPARPRNPVRTRSSSRVPPSASAPCSRS